MTASTSEKTEDFVSRLSHTYAGSDSATAHHTCAFVVCLNVFEMRPSNSQSGFAAAFANNECAGVVGSGTVAAGVRVAQAAYEIFGLLASTCGHGGVVMGGHTDANGAVGMDRH